MAGLNTNAVEPEQIQRLASRAAVQVVASGFHFPAKLIYLALIQSRRNKLGCSHPGRTHALLILTIPPAWLISNIGHIIACNFCIRRAIALTSWRKGNEYFESTRPVVNRRAPACQLGSRRRPRQRASARLRSSHRQFNRYFVGGEFQRAQETRGSKNER